MSAVRARVADVSQALYRRYRPETFADVIGQEHVTEPLMQALSNDKVSHAYLFSGPRGCGKTTSARILARCLNCAKGPTGTPCGECDSCRDLARDGAGSLDVIEIDAASHGGVEDARDLREKAFFSPASSRFKIYIIDEAHMVSPAGFNALLKVVEEPPPHLKFIFATTEPEKVIGTIRSRTHHYPFRLIPPGRMQDYLARLCEHEGVTVEKGVLPLVVRAGRGSARDSLSVLDQLIGGAGPQGVSYRLATALLGYTDVALLDDTVEAFAAGDGARVFRLVDRVIEGGHDPRRFTEDMLERLRDLIIMDAVADAAAGILGDVPADQLERMRQQAAHFGSAELSRAADIVNAGLTEMRGATAPRLQLELICARVLLPAATDDERGLLARLDRLERRLAVSGTPSAEQAPGVPPAPAPQPTPAARTATVPEPPVRPVPEPEPAPRPEPAPQPQPGPDRPAPGPDPDPWPTPAPETGAPQHQAAAAPAAGGAVDVTAVRRMWPDVLTRIAGMRRATWTLVSQNAQVAAVEGNTLTLSMTTAGLRDTFLRGGSDEIVRQALIDELGVDWRVEAIVDPSHGGSGSPSAGGPDPRRAGAPAPAAGGSGRPPADDGWGEPSAPAARQQQPAAGAGSAGEPQGATPAQRPPAASKAGDSAGVATSGAARARAAAAQAQQTRGGAAPDGQPAPAAAGAVGVRPEDDSPAADDPDLEDSGLSGVELLQRDLGAKVIGEFDNT
jgi:DNA polymerase-3 subunit gamma/tau